jgi:[protein-PII] uridylyltransferase
VAPRRLQGVRRFSTHPETDLTASPLTPFLELRSQVASQRIGDGGPETCAALTAGLDSALRELAADLAPGAAVVALGGYGRREQCLWSDIDVMLLRRGGDPDPMVRAVLYPLWDAHLKVGHSVRTIEESREAGRERLDTLTSLLSARLVAGDTTLFAELMTTVAELVRTRPLSPRLVAQERERRALDPYPTMRADLKEGRGALRTHQGFWWERRRAELVGLPTESPDQDEAGARDRLLAIRNALHAAAGRAEDRFVVDLREPAARWLDEDVYSVAAGLTAALHTGDRIADRRWPDLHVEQDQMVGLGRRIFGAIRSRFSPSQPLRDPDEKVLSIAVRAAARPEGAWFESSEEASVRAAPRTDWTATDRAAFISLLSGGARGRAVFGRLEALGWVEEVFPEWGPVGTAPQLAPFHDHPVGAHLWRTVDEILALTTGGGEAEAIADDVGSTEELVLAAFFHDIGKARGGDHDVVGAELAAGFLRRTGFGPATIGVVVHAVRHHLLLSETATRRDIADLDVIDEVAAKVGDLHALRVLYLLTIADLTATGTTMWNAWRATLLRRLFGAVAQAIEAGGAVRATADVEAIMEAGGARFGRRSVEEHLAALPNEYLDVATPHDILWHLDVVADLDGPATLSVHPADPDRVLVVGEDRTGFLLAVTSAFTAHGIEVADARLHTRSDGIALDTFHVRDDRTGNSVPEERWGQVTHGIHTALADRYALRPVIRERRLAYRRADHDPTAVDVRAHQTSRFTALEVRAPDRVALLADVVAALHDEGLNVHLARIDTMGGEARDIFHVTRLGVPIRIEPELAALCGRLRDRLRT